MIIRDRTPQDVPAVADLARESIAWHAETFPDIKPAPSRESLIEGFEQPAASPESYFRVADAGGALVGFLTAQLNPPPAGGIEAFEGPFVYIADVAVTQGARRRGIGRALLEDLESWAVDRGAGAIRLSMHAGNGPAARLYESLGYRPSWITYRKDLDRRVR